MVYIFEGMDNCLKDTIIYKLRRELSAATHVLKYSNPPSIDEKEKYQRDHFTDMFSFLEKNISAERNFILNRAHLGEYVYGPIYRNYDSSWIFEIEKKFLLNIGDRSKDVIMILLYDSNNEQLKKREDGRSFSKAEDNNIDLERLRFLEAFERCAFPTKYRFNLSDYLIENSDNINAQDILSQIMDLSIRHKNISSVK